MNKYEVNKLLLVCIKYIILKVSFVPKSNKFSFLIDGTVAIFIIIKLNIVNKKYQQLIASE